LLQRGVAAFDPSRLKSTTPEGNKKQSITPEGNKKQPTTPEGNKKQQGSVIMQLRCDNFS